MTEPLPPPATALHEESAAPLAVPASLTDLVADRRWARARPDPFGAAVYHLATGVDAADLCLKQGHGAVADVLADELTKLRWLAMQGAMVPTVLAFVRREDTAWLLTTEPAGRTAAAYLNDTDNEARPMVVAEIARFLRAVHDLPVEDCPFNSGHALWLSRARDRLGRDEVNAAAFSEDHAGWPPFQVWQKMMTLLPMTVDPVVAHGTFTLGSLRMADGRVTGCVDVARAGVADRYQDIALLWKALKPFGPDLQATFLRECHIMRPDDRKRQLHLCLDEFF